MRSFEENFSRFSSTQLESGSESGEMLSSLVLIILFKKRDEGMELWLFDEERDDSALKTCLYRAEVSSQ